MKINNKKPQLADLKLPEQLREKLKFEISSGFPARTLIGIDEVGMGCLAGPVVACAVKLPDDFQFAEWQLEIDDSKKLSEKKRKELVIEIQKWAPVYGIGLASPQEIDEINILNAAHLAMRRALEKLKSQTPELEWSETFGLVDGKHIPKQMPLRTQAIVKGDALSFTIGCASILAKVYRDDLMGSLDNEFPGYQFAKHKGYGTQVHREAIEQLGPSVMHRRSFLPAPEVQASLF